MMTNDMIEADLALRGWQHHGKWFIKIDAGGAHWLSPEGSRVMWHNGGLGNLPDLAPTPLSRDELCKMHDVITKWERGMYDPQPDGKPSHVARVDSVGAPERVGVQTDQSDMGYRRPRRGRSG